jgi:WD40 repeat protein
MKTSSKQILRFVVAIWILIAASLACNTSTSPTITQVVQVTQVVTTLADGTVATSIPLAPTADIPAASVPSPTERPDIQILADGVQVTALTFSPEGNFLAAGYENALHIWDVIAGQEIRTFQTSGTITDIAFRDNNTVVASIFPAEINTYSIGFGEMLEGLTDTGYYEKTAFSEDGNHLAVLNNTNNDIIFFDVPGKEYLKVIDNNEFGYSMALSTNNNVLAYGQSDSNKIVLVNTTTWKEIYSFDGPGHSMTISRDRPLLAYSTDDSISIVNVSTGQRLHTMVLGDWTFSMDISNDGTLLASSPANSVGITIWDVATGQVIRTLPDVNFVKVAFSPDNRLLASGDSFEKGTLRIFNLPGLGIEAPSSFTMPTPTGGGTGKILVHWESP